MRIFKSIAVVIVVWAGLYLLGAFTSLKPNPKDWLEPSRFTYAWLSFALSGMGVLAVYGKLKNL